jgi:hypothetical protein
LNPKKYKEVVKDTAESNDLDYRLVEKVVEFYYNKVYKCIISLEHTDILLNNLGTFCVRHDNLKKAIEKYDYYLNNKENLVFTKYESYKKHEEKHKRMQILLKQIQDRNERKKDFQSKKAQGNS